MSARFGKTVLGLALFRGSLHARVMRGKEVVASWDAPGPLAGLDGLKEALAQVPEQTGFRGESVVIVIASSQLEHQTVKHPPMRERDLEAFLSRKVRHAAADGGRQAWSWHMLHASSKAEHQVALHLLPLQLVHVFLDFCRTRNYQVDQVVPLASALGWSARDLPLEPGQWGLVAAEMGSATTLVIADPAGKLALVRELSFGLTDSDSLDRLSKELNRSILFAKQQFGIAVSGLWIAVSSDENTQPVLARSISDATVAKLPTSDPPAFWLQQLVGLNPDIHDNMVPRPMRRLNERRRHLEAAFSVAVAIHVVFVLVLLGLKLIGDRSHASVQGSHLDRRMEELRAEKTELESRNLEIALLRDQTRAISSFSWDAKPGWLFGWIAAHIPNDLRLTSASIERPIDSSTWKVRLHGVAPREATIASSALREFQTALQTGEPKLEISKPWHEQWRSNLQSGATWDLDSTGKPFLIEGSLR